MNANLALGKQQSIRVEFCQIKETKQKSSTFHTLNLQVIYCRTKFSHISVETTKMAEPRKNDTDPDTLNLQVK